VTAHLEQCRCGHAGDGVHPCHWNGYACRKPAKRRFYALPMGSYSLAGCQPKVAASETWACDECWRAYVGANTEHAP
jgi:hypothetical protein